MTKTYSSKTTVRDGNKGLMRFLKFGTKFVVDNRVKQTFYREIDKLDEPAIVLCTHGSAYDLIYAGKMLFHDKPQFCAARLYFYHKKLAWLLRVLGAFPKSMFSADVENVKNCMRVLNKKRTLVMMPEARLSTVGKFEGIQDSTYRFIQKMNVAVYAVRLDGSYFAKPKWGDKLRKGSLVQASLTPLFAAGETKTLAFEEVKQRIDDALVYDEFEWLESHPEIHYKSKTLAEGLENVLYLCPHCKSKYQLKTDKLKIFCPECGFERSLDSRYSFTVAEPFTNFAQWYEYQKAEMEKEILAAPNWTLESEVTLKHHSLDGRKMLREAGHGVCRLDKTGLTYCGEEDGKFIEKHFPLKEFYRLLFGAGEDFEIYEGEEIYFFVPENKRSCVAWYIASELLKKIYD